MTHQTGMIYDSISLADKAGAEVVVVVDDEDDDDDGNDDEAGCVAA